MKNNQIVWFTGAPGSKWSGTANVLQSIEYLNFNTTDRSPEREYKHTGPNELSRSITHTGAYFGPGHGIGEEWEHLDRLDVAAVEKEISDGWQDSSWGRILVKGHILTHHLDYVAETWPNNPIIMVLRPDEKCENGWFGAGGFDIFYPDYRPFYKDDETMKRMIKEHNQCILKFCEKREIKLHKFSSDYLREQFNWSTDDIANEEFRLWIAKHLKHTETLNDVSIAIYKPELLFS
jgi:hypothetical protein